MQRKSPRRGRKKIAQGKAEGRNPGNSSATGTDPEGVAPNAEVAPLQGADNSAAFPGVSHRAIISVTSGDAIRDKGLPNIPVSLS